MQGLAPAFAEGSSPLARGTLVAFIHALHHRGLIPARAGNTDAVLPLTSYLRAHPRSRGEHTITAKPKDGYVGSSPLARGTLLLTEALRGHPRLIPARAGNTFLQD